MAGPQALDFDGIGEASFTEPEVSDVSFHNQDRERAESRGSVDTACTALKISPTKTPKKWTEPRKRQYGAAKIRKITTAAARAISVAYDLEENALSSSRETSGELVNDYEELLAELKVKASESERFFKNFSCSPLALVPGVGNVSQIFLAGQYTWREQQRK